MKPFIKLLPLLLILTLFNIVGFAQAKPVQLSVISIPPSPTYLSDYVGTTSDKIKLQILLTDLNSTREVYLKLNFSGPGIEFLTPDNLSNIPYYTLTGGIPLMLYNADLSYYFEAANTGLSTNDYVQQLNEGAYFICFDVYDKITNQKLSNSTCHSTLLLQNDPPFLNLPFNKEIVQANASNSFQRFQWTPRHTPTSGYHYKFKIAEVKDGYEETPELSLITFGADYEEPNVINNYYDLPLIGSVFSIDTSNSSKVYVWQVQAYELNGVDTINNFKNNGNSEIWIFKYDVASCTEPDQPVVIETYKTGAKITWSVPTGSNCQVHYREYNTARWFSADSVSSPFLLSNLKGDSTEYEVQIGTMCNGGMFYGPSTTFRTKGVTETGPEISCTISANNGITYQVDKTTLVIGDKFKAGKFTIYIDDSLTKVGTNFSGVGHIQVPYLYFANIKVRFKEVSINDSNVMYAGEVVTTWDPTMANIIDLDALLNGGDGVGKVITGDITADYAATWSIGSESDIQTTTTNNADGTVSGVIRIKVGNSFVDINAVLPYSITDKDGNYYAVGKDGKTTKVAEPANLKPAGIASLIKVDPTKGGANFSLYNYQGEKTVYAFDAWRDEYIFSNTWSERYEEIGTKRVGAKCIAPAKPDILLVTITSLPSGADYKDIKFITGKGIQFTATLVGSNTFKLNLLGGPSGDAQEIFVTYKKNDEQCITFNKLLMAAYEPKVVKVAIVPVGNSTIPSGITAQGLQDKLNEIYNPICVTFKVRIADKFENSSWDNGLNMDENEKLSLYTSDMKLLNSLYSEKSNLDNHEYVLFVIPKFLGTNGNVISGELGAMPRGKRFGYLNSSELQNKTLTNWAELGGHELGHGVFKLKHVTDPDYRGTNTSFQLTDNLMTTSNNGTFVCKYQWDALHDPGIVLGIFEKNDDSKSISLSKDILNQIRKKFANADGSLTFIAPSGQPITLPAEVEDVDFSTCDQYISPNGIVSYAPMGTLIAFSLNDKSYFPYYREGKFAYFIGRSATQINPKNIDINEESDNGETLEVDQYFDPLTKNIIKTQITGITCFVTMGASTGKYNYNLFELPIDASKLTHINEAKYCGSGDLINRLDLYSSAYFVFKSNLASLSKMTVIETGSIYPELSSAAIEFLNNEASVLFTNEKSRFITCIAISHAQQLTLNKNYDNCVSRPKLNTDLKTVANNTSYNDLQMITEANLAYQTWADRDLNYFNDLDKTIENINNNIKTKTGKDAVYEFIYTKISDQECLYTRLSFETRIYAIWQLLSSAPHNDAEKMINILLKTTLQNGQFGNMVYYLQNNSYELYYKLADNIEGDEYKDFHEIIAKLVLGDKGIDPDKLTLIDNCITGTTDIVGNWTNDDDAGCFYMRKEYGPTTNLQTVQYFASKLSGGSMELLSSITGHIEKTIGEPFDIIYYRLPENNNILHSTEKFGFFSTRAYGYYLIKRKILGDALEDLRVVVDAGVLISALFTGGGTVSTLVSIDAAFAGADLTIMASSSFLDDKDQEALNEVWNKVYGMYGALRITGGVVQTALKYSIPVANKIKLTISLEKLKDVYSFLKTQSPQLAADFRNNMKSLTKELVLVLNRIGNLSAKEIISTKLIYKLGEIDFVEGFKAVSNNAQLKFNNIIYGKIIWLNLEYEFATLVVNSEEFALRIKNFRPNGISKSSYDFVGSSENIRYYDGANNSVEFGKLEYYLSKASPRTIFVVRGVSGAGNVDDLFSSIINQGDFQGFRNLCKNNPKISVELVDGNWSNFVTSTKFQYGIAADRNIAIMTFDGQEFIIASGKKYSGQMVNSNKFLPKQFVEDIEAGNGIFEPSISTRHLDTESIGLEYFAKQKGAIKGKKYPEVKGEIKITSDLCPCPSCSAIFQQFSEMFTNVSIKIITSPKLHY